MSYPKVLISLTSYPRRIPYAIRSIETLMHQTVKVDEIHLNLSKDEFKGGSNDLLGLVKEIESAGVYVDWREDNLRPHNKYYWIMKDRPDDIVITVDDDIVYPPTLVQSLLGGYYRHPNAIISNRTHIITSESPDRLTPYRTWVMEQTEIVDEPRFDLLATGVGGVLYPPGIFDEGAFDLRAIKESSLLADDLWLLIQEARLHIPVVNTPAFPGLYYVPGSQEEGLYVENLENGRNDVILDRLFKLYPEAKAAILGSARRLPAEEDLDTGNRGNFDDKDSLIRRIVNRIR